MYNSIYSNVVRRFFEATNTTTKYGDCPIPAQAFRVYDFSHDDYGEYSPMPDYVPGRC
jgi:hypothetical protein